MPLLLITGLSAVADDWQPLDEALAEERVVVTMDNRYIGRSRGPKCEDGLQITTKDMARDAADLIAHLDIRKLAVCGFSMGGMVMAELLCLGDPRFEITHSIHTATSAKRAHSDLISNMPQPRFNEDGTMSPEERRRLAREFMLLMYDPAWLINPKNLARLEERVDVSIATRRPAPVIQAQVQAIAGYDCRKALTKVSPQLNALIIHGELDRAVFVSEQRYLLEALKHTRVRVASLPDRNIGHWWYDYFPLIFWVRLINDFLLPELESKL